MVRKNRCSLQEGILHLGPKRKREEPASPRWQRGNKKERVRREKFPITYRDKEGERKNNWHSATVQVSEAAHGYVLKKKGRGDRRSQLSSS